MPVKIVKGDGTKEMFDPQKLLRSLIGAGARADVATMIVAEVSTHLKEGDATRSIYHRAFDLLKHHAGQPIAGRYSLRRAIMDLGPTGFAFETLVGEIFRARGYTAETDVMLRGSCVTHELDIVAQKNNELVLVETKFHNDTGYKTDVKVALYIHARAEDLHATDCDGRTHKEKKAEFWLVTNTKFTDTAISYGKCVGLKLVGWNYPASGNLQDLIEETGLHPLTCLTTLSKTEKENLFENGVVLCRTVQEYPSRLSSIGISKKKVDEVLNEARMLCTPEARND